ncbi:MAG: hypothetical protein WED09_04715 [Homoserinimonas sp.]
MNHDRIYGFTRTVAALVLPFLAVASVLLYLLPRRTDELFAWTINPPLTAMFLASAYLGGIWFFVGVLMAARWHRVAVGFPAVMVFSALLGMATLIHWDRFHHDHVSFIVWAVLYLTTPFLVLIAMVTNSRVYTGRPERRDYEIPLLFRALPILIGLAALATGALLYASPGNFLGVWPWELTPLTARVVAAVLTLPGMVGLWLIFEPRWSSFRLLFQAQLTSLVFICLALVFARADLNWSRVATAWFVAGMAVSLVTYLAFYLYCERHSRKLAAEDAAR